MISGKEAMIALANGEEVEFQREESGKWQNAITLNLFSFNSSLFKFRLKPRTISINGIEVPAPFEPKTGEKYWIIETSDKNSYSYISSFENNEQDESLTKLGAWRTEDEIKQVVAALRSIFKPQ